jgi:hypothetical protein
MRHARRHNAAARRRKVVAGSAVAVLALVAALLWVFLSGGSTPPAAQAQKLPPLHANRCPLTDLPPPGGTVPRHEAVAVKVGNEPNGARPQSGLDEADIVYDTPAESFIMRYIAVYQCGSASSIGPTRSVRWVDYHILQALGQPVLAFAGGIDPNLHAVEHLGWLKAANLLGGAASAGTRITTRVPPDNLYTSTSALLGLFPTGPPPTPVFVYTASLPAGARTATELAINFSAGTDVVWKWDPARGGWLHTYSGTVDLDALTNQPVTTTNIVVQIVHFTIGPYIESTGGTGDIQSQTVGSGQGYVFRDGMEIAVTWHRPTLDSATTFTDAAGQTVGLAPGRTWVEIVPDTVASSAGGLTITH